MPKKGNLNISDFFIITFLINSIINRKITRKYDLPGFLFFIFILKLIELDKTMSKFSKKSKIFYFSTIYGNDLLPQRREQFFKRLSVKHSLNSSAPEKEAWTLALLTFD